MSAYRSSADGNCLYNSIAISLYGEEVDVYELRVRSSVTMYLAAETLFTPHVLSDVFGRQITDEDIRFIIDSSVDQQYIGKKITDCVRSHAISMVKNGKYATVMDVIALCNMLSITIDLIYPCNNNPFTQKQLVSGRLKGGENLITVAWTHTSNTGSESTPWIPNHFVPCAPKVVSNNRVPY